MTEPLPSFRYHPDPVAAGSIEPSDAVCRCCGRARGYIYAGPVCAEEEFDDALCPWCITDGQAAARFAASLHRRGRGGEPWRLGRRARGRGERGRRAHARLHRLAAQADIGFAGEEWEEY
ncbi:MAG TPA: CbrC family protein, partial [Gemmatimonadaceae bacterium]|nr:CbrC family protein [Gemmatimonadaceae bacterium]